MTSPISAANSQRLHVAHLITGLTTGGAEMMLLKLLSAADRGAFTHSVISMTSEGDLAPHLRRREVPVHALDMRRGYPDVRAVLRVRRLLRHARVDVLQTWMYHADLLGAAAAIGTRLPLIWGIHHSVLDPRHTKLLTRLTLRAGACLSRIAPQRIVCCSDSTRTVHAALGYPSHRMVVIPNGFDLAEFQFRPSDRDSVRRELALPARFSVVGVVGRYDPNKDHRNFATAAAHILALRPNTRFVLVGQGCSSDNSELLHLLRAAGVLAQCHVLGRRSDVSRLMCALDVLCSSSSSEGFPNVIGEAMACQVPCAVTDCGDSAAIVGDVGRVVPPRDSAALASAVVSLLDLTPHERTLLGTRARQRIADRYGIATVARQYERLYGTLATERAR